MKKSSIENYVLRSIDLSSYGIKAIGEKNKISALFRIFQEEYWHEYNKKRFNNNIKRGISEWLSGLPSCVNIVFYYNDIRKKGITLGLISKKATERQFEKFEKDWFNLIAETLVKIYNRHKSTGLKAPASKGLTTLCAMNIGVTGRRKKDGTQKKGYIAKKGGKLVKKTTKTRKVKL